MSLDYDPELILRLVGPLRLTRRDRGLDVALRSAKAQGLLALIGSAPALRRSRAFLQDKLWSDSPPELGSASLRQTIHRLRETVGPDNGWLITEPGWVGLDPTRVSVVLDAEAQDWEATGEPPEFCEGLDIADAEFEDWIRDQRLAFEDRLGDAPPPPRPPSPIRLAIPVQRDPGVTLFVAAVDLEDRGVADLAQLLSVQVAMAVGRLGGARVQLEERGGADPPRDALQLAVQGYRVGDKATIQARLSEDAALVWSNNRTFAVGHTAGGASKALEVFIAEVTAAASHHLGRGGTGEARSQVRAGYRALESLYALEPFTLAECERVFAATTDGPAANVHKAWRAQIRAYSLVERLGDPAEVGREAMDLIADAVGADPLNPLVNAIASEVALLVEDRPHKAAQLARLAVGRDPFSPYARACSAMAEAWLGNTTKAHVEALRALRLASGLPNQALWVMRCCVTAVRSRRYPEAARFAQAAHDLSPSFKPPLRFLAALRFRERDLVGAAQALHRLKVLEPDFSLKLMECDDYPVTSMRNSPPLMEVTRSGLL